MGKVHVSQLMGKVHAVAMMNTVHIRQLMGVANRGRGVGGGALPYNYPTWKMEIKIYRHTLFAWWLTISKVHF